MYPEFNPCVKKILWRRKWQPTSVTCLENPTDRGAWLATVHGEANSLTEWSTHAHIYNYTCFKRLLLFSRSVTSDSL